MCHCNRRLLQLLFCTLALCVKIRQLLCGGCEDLGGHVGRGVRRGAGGGGHDGVGGGAAEEGGGQVSRYR